MDTPNDLTDNYDFKAFEISDMDERSENKSESGVRSDKFLTSYEDRKKITPTGKDGDIKGEWEGKRGESVYRSNNDEVNEVLQEKGLVGIEYKNGVPDFLKVSEAEVDIGHMTSNRDAVGGDYSYKNDDPNTTMSYLTTSYEDPGNYKQADLLLANERCVSPKEIKGYRENNELMWHECNDMSKMQLVPAQAHNEFRHSGGVAERRALDNSVEQSFEDFPEDGTPEIATDEEILRRYGFN